MRLTPTLYVPALYGQREHEAPAPSAEPNPYAGLAFSLAFSAIVIYAVLVVRGRGRPPE